MDKNDLDLLTTLEAAVEQRRHIVTVRKALESGELHGKQRRPGGRWLIERQCLEAWSGGFDCPHQ
ncbi:MULTISPECIES: hypothetical protein [unclassified Agrococcus]|uniref:hypothetical protein n=1 Tax=unclassified Agrococcus TaxID=2615065 RepID=UPI00360677CD